MSDSVYRKTPLPVKLNLNDRNTRVQLSTSEQADAGRGALEGVGLASSASSQSQKDSKDVMVKDLRDWLSTHGINGPPPNAEAEQRAMWKWIRDFHKEYNDDWFSRNMPRLHEQFRPVFLGEMKKMKAEIAAAAASQPAAAAATSGGADLLDFDSQPAAAAAATPSGCRPQAVDDLLSLDAVAPAAAAASAVASQAPVYASAVTPAVLAPGGGGYVVAAAPVAGETGGGGLLDLDLGGLSLAPSVAPTKPVAQVPAIQLNPAAQAPSQGSDLLDLMM